MLYTCMSIMPQLKKQQPESCHHFVFTSYISQKMLSKLDLTFPPRNSYMIGEELGEEGKAMAKVAVSWIH